MVMEVGAEVLGNEDSGVMWRDNGGDGDGDGARMVVVTASV